MSEKKNRKNTDYSFREPKNTACFVCNHILGKERSVLFVCHDKEDYSWQFLCGKNDHTEDNFRIISLEEVVKIDNTLNDLSDMPPGICAEREKVGMKWIPFKLKE